jgi:hypothetical protein
MPKFVVETVQVMRFKYFVEAPEAVWATDSIVMNELEFYSAESFSEDVISTTEVTEWPHVDRTHVNGAIAVIADNSSITHKVWWE